MILGGKKRLITISLLILLILSLAVIKFWKYIIYLPPFWEKLTAPVAATPLEAYEKFRSALAANKKEEALRYVIKEKQDLYREMLSDPSVQVHYISGVTDLTEEFKNLCEDQAVCLSLALYSYRLEILEPYEEEIMGKKFIVPAGVQNLEMRFVELKPGHWKISDL